MARTRGEKPKGNGRAASPAPEAPTQAAADVGGVQPWHLLVFATMAAMAAGAFLTTGTPVVNVVFVSVAIATAGLATVGLYRTLMPLVMPEAGEQIEMVAGRTRAALEREKMLVLRSIKELEFDRAMRKISEPDYQEVVGRLRVRAAGLLRQLDGGGLGYRELIERDLASRVGTAAARTAVAEEPAPPKAAPGMCPSCGVDNGADARFCKACGARVGATS